MDAPRDVKVELVVVGGTKMSIAEAVDAAFAGELDLDAVHLAFEPAGGRRWRPAPR